MKSDPKLLLVPRAVSLKKKIQHITILYNVVKKLEYGEEADLLADYDTVKTATAIHRTLKEEGFKTLLFELNENNLEDLFELKTDLIFNLCYGIGSISRTEAQVVKILEKLDIPFTGAGSRSITTTTDKEATKKKFIEYNIPTPAFQVFVTSSDRHDPRLHFPLIVKPKNQDCSLGIHNNAVVENKYDLQDRVAFLLKSYKEPILVEEYIEGRELNVTLIGNNSKVLMLPISEIVFGQSYIQENKWKIVDFEAKWIEESINFTETLGVCPAKLDPEMEKKIEDLTILAYKACECRDYARIDLRLSSDNIPYFLEINLNPGIGPEDGTIRSAKAAGFSYTSFLKEIIKITAARC